MRALLVPTVLALAGAVPAQSLTWIQSPINGHFYAKTAPMTWLQAEALAVQHGGHLATVRSQAENTWIYNTFNGATDHLWIGFNDQAQEGVWVWSSGEPVNYTFWCAGEPNNASNSDFGHIWQGRACWNDTTSNPTPGILELLPTPSWQPASNQSPPSPRWGMGLAYDAQRGRAVLFGGQVGGQFLAETWEWNGTTWIPGLPQTWPSPRETRMVYDAARQKVVLFGGQDGAAFFGDTWEYTANSWVQRSPSASPPARNRHAMAYDAARQRVVVYGGFDGSGTLADTWLFDGATWSQAAAAGPGPRRDAAMAYDRRRQRVVLFGGRRPGGQLLNDTWEWDGAQWTQVLPALSPPARDQHALAYDLALEQVVLYGGWDGSTELADVWLWDGVAWTWADTCAAPGRVRVHRMVTDTNQSRVLLFGGHGPGRPFDPRNDLWQSFYPSAAGPFGSGCGSPPLSLSAASGPRIGATFTATIGNVPASTTMAFVSLGASRTSVRPFALPLDLTGFGLPGCFLYHDLFFFLGLPATLAGNGTATFSLAVPNIVTLAGDRAYAQAWVTAPGVNAAGILTSNGLGLVFGF